MATGNYARQDMALGSESPAWQGPLQLPMLREDPDFSAPEALTPTVVDDLPREREIKDGEVFIIRNQESRYLTHLFHKYAGKFIPHIPRWAITRYLPRNAGAVVLDPFVGSGTTLVEARLHGQVGYGLDIDPLARLITKVKTTPIPEARLQTLSSEVEALLLGTATGTFRPSIPTLSHWFSEQAVTDLSAIHEIVEHFRGEPDVYDFLTICFSAIIRRASNADNQTMKTYVSHTNPKTLEPVRPLFLAVVRTYTDRLYKFGLLAPPVGGVSLLPSDDARAIDATWLAQGLPPADLVVTSPPYIKSVDYIYNQMAELFWIGQRWGLEDQTKQNLFKRRYIGHDRASASEAATLREVGLTDIDEYLARIFKHDRALAHVAWRYFCDMDTHFAAVRSILRPGAHYVLVVGDSTLAGIAVPTRHLLLSYARRHGFQVVSQFGYEIRNKHMHFPRGGRGGVVEHDWILDLVSTG